MKNTKKIIHILRKQGSEIGGPSEKCLRLDVKKKKKNEKINIETQERNNKHKQKIK